LKNEKTDLIILLSLSFGLTMAKELTLDSCKQLTLVNNKKIIEARLKVEESEQVKKQAFTNYFPQVSGGFVAMQADDYIIQEEIPAANLPVYDGNPANMMTASEFAYFPGMDLNMLDYTNLGHITAVEPLYMGGQVRNGNKLAALGQEISVHELILSEEEALIKTEEQFWTLISLMKKMKTIDSYEKLLDTLHKDVPISGWWSGTHEIKEHQIKVNMAENRLAGFSELFVLQIEKSYKELIESHQQVSIANKSVEQVQEHLKVTRDNYDAGLVGTSDMLEAQAMFQEAEDNYSDALCISQIKLAYYKKVTANSYN